MQNKLTKITAFLCVIVISCTLAVPRTVKADYYSEVKEVEDALKTEKGVAIDWTVLELYEPENYYFKDYYDEYLKINTYKLYNKETKESFDIGGSGGSLFLFNDEIYLIDDGEVLKNQFRYVGYGDDHCEYWVYFGKDGKMVKDTVIDGTFKIDKNGFFDFKRSDLYKRLLKQFRKDEKERARYINDSEEIRKKYAKKGYSKKQIDELIDKKVSDFVEKSVKNYSISYSTVTDYLNKQYATRLGKWVKIKDYVEMKKRFIADGHFVKDKKGNLRYWANSIMQNEELWPSSSVLNYNKFLDGYKYQPDEQYDWRTSVIAEKEYVRDKYVNIDGSYYYFDKKGYAAKNKWVSLDGDFYFDENGKQVMNDWAPRNGELYHIDEKGWIDRGWVKDSFGHVYLSYDNTIYYGSKEKEYEVNDKIHEFAKRPGAGEQVGICSVFADKLVHYLFGKNAKGTTYSYSWDKIKVGDTVSGAGHIFVVMEKDKDRLVAAESNENGDKMEHYGRVPVSRQELDEMKKKGKMKYTFTTYYSTPDRDLKVFTPQKVQLTAKSSNQKATINVSKSKFAVGYCIYMAKSENGKFELVKTIKGEDKRQYTTKELANGDYYFKARAYVTINGKKLWSPYSNVEKCEISK